jgi:hypothetical protein
MTLGHLREWSLDNRSLEADCEDPASRSGKATAKAPKGSECTGTSVTLWTGHVRYKSLTLLGLSFGLGLVLAFVSKYLTGRRGRGNVGIPTGFPKSVGRVGQAGFVAFHAFHTLSFPWPVLGNTYSKTTVSTEARFRQQEPLVPDADYSATCLDPICR